MRGSSTQSLKFSMPGALLDLKSPEALYAYLADAVLHIVGKVPETAERKSRTPEHQARQIASTAQARAAVAAGAMASPPGVAGMLTLLPELAMVWHIQAQMVADIAAVYGRTAKLSPEQMIYCLFRTTAAQAVSALVVTVGKNVLVRQPTLRALQHIALQIGIKLSQRLLAKGIARWMPLVGAVSVSAFSYYETGQVGKAAMELFGGPIDVEGEKLPLRAPRKRAVEKRRPGKAAPAKQAKRTVARATSAVRKSPRDRRAS